MQVGVEHYRPSTPLTGVFATRSPDRPNPIGLHRVTITKIESQLACTSPCSRRSTAPVEIAARLAPETLSATGIAPRRMER